MHGGPSAALETITHALVQAGVQVAVATTDDDGAARLDVPLGQPVERDHIVHWFFRRQTQFYKFSLPLTRWLAENTGRYDAVHIHALFSFATMPASFFAARARVPYIVRPLGTLNRVGMEQYHRTLKRVSFPLVERPLLERAAFLHYTSESERAQAHAVGVTRRSVVIPIGVAPGTIPETVHGEWLKQFAPQWVGHTIFLFLARLDPIKGLDALLPAFAQLCAQNPNVALIIAGAGESEYERELRTTCAQLGIQNRVLFTGYVEGDNKRALLRDADVFVLPSRSENQGVAVVEAMAAGLPVLVTPDVGIAQEIAASGAGIISARDSSSLAEAMQSLAADPAQRAEMGRRGRKLVSDKFSLDAMTQSLIDLYETVIREARMP